MIQLDLPPHARLISLGETVDGKWEIYLSPRPGHRWVVRGGPAPSIELALIEAVAQFDQVRKEVAVPASSPAFAIDLADLGL
jgi:hypothetical protein